MLSIARRYGIRQRCSTLQPMATTCSRGPWLNPGKECHARGIGQCSASTGIAATCSDYIRRETNPGVGSGTRSSVLLKVRHLGKTVRQLSCSYNSVCGNGGYRIPTLSPVETRCATRARHPALLLCWDPFGCRGSPCLPISENI